MKDQVAGKASVLVCRIIASLLVGLLMVMHTPESPARENSVPNVPDGRSAIISEPVFGGKAYVYEAGMDHLQSVVLVHGIGDKASRDWNGLIPLLARRYHVVTFDLPGFGRSTKANKLYSPEKYVVFVKYIASRYIHGSFDLVGHSMGAAIALRYAATYPADVRTLVLADVAGILYRMAYSQYLAHLGIDAVPSLYPNEKEQLHHLVGNMLGFLERLKPDPELIVSQAALRRDMLHSDPAKIAALALVLDNFSSVIPRVNAPTLIIWGDRDPLAPLRTARVLIANIPQARLEILQDCGHTPMDDQPLKFNELVLRELKSPGPTRAQFLARTGPVNRLPVSGRTGSCRKQHNMVFEGDYDRIDIRDCRDVRVRNAHVGELHIDDASVRIDNSRIGDKDGGLVVDNANVTITGGTIDAPVAITASDSHLDLAGVTVIGSKAAVRAPRRSRFLFSVSYIYSPYSNGSAHGLWVLGPENRF
ncbi:MAG: alpha/beta fold hydrolase [Acidiferrobacterales bacterium]